jgi:hypothetical protein
MTDRIEQLLREVDHTSAAATPDAALSDRVWRAFSMQRFRRRIAAGGATLALVAVAMTTWMHGLTPTQITVSNPRTNSVIVARHMDDASVVLDRVMISDRLIRAQEKLSQLRLPIAQENPIDHAAYTIVFHADRLAAAQSDKRAAEKSYRDVIQLFPDSSAAQVAQQRLSKIEKEI